MEIAFTDEQDMLRESIRKLLDRYSPPAAVRELEDDPVGYSTELWEELAGMGLLGLTIPEKYGGSEMSALENVILYEELGRALAPTPHFVTSVLGAGALLAGESEELRAEWLPKIAEGKAILTTAWFEPEASSGPEGIGLTAEQDGDRFRLTGTKILIPFASSATRILVLGRELDGDVGVFPVDPAGSGVNVEREQTLAADASYRITFDGAEIAASDRIGSWDAWQETLVDGFIALAAFALAGAERAHEMAVEYAKERVQFGKPIGSFQAIAHPLADAATEIEGGKTLVYEAASVRAGGGNASTLAAMAKLYGCDVFRRTTKLGQQVLGGIGFTVDIDMQLYFRRAKQLELTWGDPRYLEELIAGAELDAATPFVGIDAGPKA
ncbi:MAG: acyl-CoA dehydrogenase family protein [Actinomycetota bacterium]